MRILVQRRKLESRAECVRDEELAEKGKARWDLQVGTLCSQGGSGYRDPGS